MWSKKPLLVVLALLVVVLGLVINKLNTINGGGEEEGQSTGPSMSVLKLCPKFKPLHLAVATTPSGLKYQEIRIGKGESPKKGDTVVVKYTGWKTNGKPFDSCDVQGMEPFLFQVGVGKVIKGWDEGVLTMKVGGKRRLFVPSKLAYGEIGQMPAIEPRATLIFDVELVAVKGGSS